MSKFKLNQEVEYAGTNDFARTFFSNGLVVIGIVPDGEPIGNGEINNSGETLYRVKSNGMIYNFLEFHLKANNMVRLNNADNYEHLCNVKLTKDKFPIAYENKVQELVEECGVSREEAEKIVADMSIELELYYEKGFGLFAVESEAVESGTIYSPYSGELCEESEE